MNMQEATFLLVHNTKDVLQMGGTQFISDTHRSCQTLHQICTDLADAYEVNSTKAPLHQIEIAT